MEHIENNRNLFILEYKKAACYFLFTSYYENNTSTAYIFFNTEFRWANLKRELFLIDKRVKSIQSNSVDSLSKKLTLPYKTQLEKVRSIFKWITENIEYDVIGYHRKGIYTGLKESIFSDVDSLVQKEFNDNVVQKVLKIDGRKIYWDYELLSDKTERLDILYNDKLILSYSVRISK
jgi:hypothetical protein